MYKQLTAAGWPQRITPPEHKQLTARPLFPLFLGDKSFQQKILTKSYVINSEMAHQKQLKNTPTIERVIASTASAFCVSERSISFGQRGKTNHAREIAIYICRHHYGHFLHKIGQKFGGIKYSAVSHMVTKAHKEIEKNSILQKMEGSIRQALAAQ